MRAVGRAEEAYNTVKADENFRRGLTACWPTTWAVPRRSTTPKPLTAPGRREDLPEARGPSPHRRPQDKQMPSDRRSWAQHMGKRRIIAETGAGQHGVAAATACAMLGLQCIVYMGEEDIRRQSLNVFRMRLLEAEVISVESGTRSLKDAINEAIRDWVANVETTHYLIGSVVGPPPLPGDGAGLPERHRARGAGRRFSQPRAACPTT